MKGFYFSSTLMWDADARDAHEDGSEERRGLTVFRIFDKIRKVLDDQYDSSRRRLCRY